MYNIPASTLFIGKNLVFTPQCPSTNLLASELGQKVDTPDGTIIITDNQTSGRGQRGNAWEAQPGLNLTFSLILKPGFLQVKDQFQLNEAVSIAIADYLKLKVDAEVRIKWPNDILVGSKKVCGILIENHVNREAISHSIVGIGLNVNQHSFLYLNAGSLASLTQRQYELASELEILLKELEVRYLELKRGGSVVLEKTYLNLLYQKDEISKFRANGKEFEGIITGVNGSGQLVIQVGKEKRVFGVKEVEFLSSPHPSP